MKKLRPFRYQQTENFNPLAPTWHVIHKASFKYVGMIRKVGPNNFEVRRDQDSNYHLALGSRREAARWLLEQFSDPAIFDEDEPDDTHNPN